MFRLEASYVLCLLCLFTMKVYTAICHRANLIQKYLVIYVLSSKIFLKHFACAIRNTVINKRRDIN